VRSPLSLSTSKSRELPRFAGLLRRNDKWGRGAAIDDYFRDLGDEQSLYFAGAFVDGDDGASRYMRSRSVRGVTDAA